MSVIFSVLLPVVGILMSVLILSQAKGTGLGAAFGGGGEFYTTKRGAEDVLFKGTIILAATFLLLSFFGGITTKMNLAAPRVPVNVVNTETVAVPADGGAANTVEVPVAE